MDTLLVHMNAFAFQQSMNTLVSIPDPGVAISLILDLSVSWGGLID
jgi:hypothetical protein